MPSITLDLAIGTRLVAQYVVVSECLCFLQNGTGFSQEKLWKDGHQLYNIDSDGENSDYKLQDIHVVVSTSNIVEHYFVSINGNLYFNAEISCLPGIIHSSLEPLS